MRYLVTGGAGFIGSHIVRTLLEQGTDVRVLDNFSTGKRENLAGLTEKFNGSRFEVHEGDLRDRAFVRIAVRDVDVVFHEAAFVSVPESMEKPQDCFDVNVAATVALLDAAREAGVRRVVIASSAAVYGESDALPLKETTPTQSLSPYAASKRTDEIYAQLYTQTLGLDVVALRYFNVYGPRQNPKSQYSAVIPLFIDAIKDGRSPVIHGDGGQTRDFTYVEDVINANLLCCKASDEAFGQVYNVARGDRISVNKLAETIMSIIEIGRASCRERV